MVKSNLPENARLTGKIFPEEESSAFAFDSESREIVWAIGEMSKGDGILRPAPNIAFQIEIMPSIGQEGSIPWLIGETKIIGEDQWTGQRLSAVSSALNALLSYDESIGEKEAIITR